MAAAEAEAARRLAERAEEFRIDLEHQLQEILPQNDCPADTVFLAHLLTCRGGYHDVELIYDWADRPVTDWWGTSLGFLVDVGGLIVRFVLECRGDEFARQLAIDVGDYRPGERTPQRIEKERLLLALGYRVMSFAETEILENPATCRTRVEAVLHEMATDVLRDAGRVT